MKKVGHLLVALMLVVLLAGCTKTTKMTCNIKQGTVDLDYNLEFKGNMISKMSLKYVMDLSSYTDSQMELVEKQDFCSEIKKSMSQYEQGFENCNQKRDGKKIVIYTDINPDKITDSALDKMGSIDETKTELEKIGYKCTIK